MQPPMSIPCTVEILTHNSEKNLGRLLTCLQDFAEIIVLDGGSTDGTRAVAAQFGCLVIDQPANALVDGRIADFAAVRNTGLQLAHQPWFFFVDSDEIIPSAMVAEIRERLLEASNPIGLYEVNRLYVINGVRIEHSITYPAIQTRLFRRDAVVAFIKPVHERIQPRVGAVVGRLREAMQVPQENVFFPKKWFQYLAIESRKYRQFTLTHCLVVTFRRLAQTGLYAGRFFLLCLSGKKRRAPLAFEMSYIVYNIVHISWMWKSRLFT